MNEFDELKKRLRVIALRLLVRMPILRFIALFPTLTFWFSFPIRNISRLSKLDLNQVLNSEIMSYYKRNHQGQMLGRGYFRREWTRLSWLALEGEYEEANYGRLELIREARRLHGLDDNFIPSTLERGWTTNYGHLGCLINFRNGQKLGIIESSRRLVLRAQTFSSSRPIYRNLRKNFEFMNSNSLTSIFDSEPLFPFTDKVSYTSTKLGLKETAELFNIVSEAQIDSKVFKRERFDFSDYEEEIMNETFLDFGFAPGHPFVVLHIRETKDKYSARDSSVEAFVPAIHEILDSGNLVIRIGSSKASSLPSIPGLIDFRSKPGESKEFIHDFVISNCEYLVSSQSGPSAVAHALGVPTLVVDGIAIARYTYSTPAPSMTLPKSWYTTNGKRLSFDNILESGLGFRELAYSNSGDYLRNCSADEILCAVKEFSVLLKSGKTPRKNPAEFREAKQSVGGIGDGLISEAFFSS